MNVDQVVREFLADCEKRTKLPLDNKLRLSRKTVREYRAPLEFILLPFCEREGIRDVAGLDRKALLRLRDHLVENGARSGRQLKTPTVNSYLRSINACLGWAKREDLGASTTAKLIPAEQPVRDILSRAEIDRIENAAERERDKLIVRLMADTGIRVGELCHLRMADVLSLDGRSFLRVYGKTGHHDVPLMPDLHRRLKRYIDQTRPKHARSDRVFLSLRRSPGGNVEPLTESGVGQLIRELGDTAEIGKRVHPHAFRFAFINHQLGRMPAIYIRDVVGHTSLTMIDRVYSRAAPASAYDALLKSMQADEDAPLIYKTSSRRGR